MARFPPRISSITASFTDTGDVDVYLVDASAGAVTLTLQSPSRRRRVEVVKTDSTSNAVTVATNGTSATINGSSTLVIGAQYSAVMFVGNGLAGSSAMWRATAGYRTEALALASGKVIVGNSSGVPTAVTPSGDVTISSAGVTAIGAGKVTGAMLKPARATSPSRSPRTALLR
jgi:hypothetical protein